MTARICFVGLALILCAVQPSSATPFSSDGSTTTSGSISFGYEWDNCSGNAGVCSTSSTPGSAEVPFTFDLSLPDAPGSDLNNATLGLSLPRDQGSATITSETSTPIGISQTYYTSCQVSIFGICVDTIYHISANNYNYAPNLIFDGSATPYVDSITSPGESWSGAPTAVGSLNLISLGFGTDLLDGGDLAVSGFLLLSDPSGDPFVNFHDGSYTSIWTKDTCASSYIIGFIPGSSSCVINSQSADSYGTGDNADTDFSLSYSDTNSESGILRLNYSALSEPLPEPSSLPMLLMGLGAIGGALYLARKITQWPSQQL